MSINDQAQAVRPGEELKVDALKAYLIKHLEGFDGAFSLLQFPGGFSNLTYLLRTSQGDYVLRRPPFGANIKGGHDMKREFRVLKALEKFYGKAPKPVLFCDDQSVMGSDFYLMERMEGVILRGKAPESLDLSPDRMKSLSENAIDHLADLHLMDLDAAGLKDFGKPEGYTKRQVMGWIARYEQAATDEVDEMDQVATWLKKNIPPQQHVSLIHNDFKYDNLVLDPEKPEQIIGVLDWEMSTIGNPLMDLGTSLAYWAQADDDEVLKSFGLTWLPGNLSRKAWVERYAQRTGFDVSDQLFYYVFGAFKIGGIIQQIYQRYQKGLTQDPRFAHLLVAVKANAQNAVKALDRGGL